MIKNINMEMVVESFSLGLDVLNTLSRLKGKEYVEFDDLLLEIKKQTNLYEEDEEEDFDELFDLVRGVIVENCEDKEKIVNNSFIQDYVIYMNLLKTKGVI